MLDLSLQFVFNSKMSGAITLSYPIKTRRRYFWQVDLEREHVLSRRQICILKSFWNSIKFENLISFSYIWTFFSAFTNIISFFDATNLNRNVLCRIRLGKLAYCLSYYHLAWEKIVALKFNLQSSMLMQFRLVRSHLCIIN